MQITSTKTENLTVVLLGILVLIALGSVAHILRGIILPFLVAVFLAYLLAPIVRFLTRLRVPYSLAISIALLSTLALLFLIGTMLYTGVLSFVRGYPQYEPKLRALLALGTSYLEFLPPEWRIADLGKQLASTSVTKALLSSLGLSLTLAGNLLLTFIFMVFILVGQRHVPQRIHAAFDREQAQRICDMIQRITNDLQTYLGAKVLISLVTGVLVNLYLVFLDIDFATLWGVLAFMLNFIPSAGSILAAVPPILIAILKFHSPIPAVWTAVGLVVINISLGGIIEPRVMGQRLNLNPVLVVLSLLFWGWLWGITGMVLAVPIMATIKIVCENIPSLRFVSVLISSK